MEIIILIVLMMAVTYIPRAIPVAFIDKMKFSKKMEKFLNIIPYTAMASLIFPGVLSVDSSRWYVGVIGAMVAVLLSLTRYGKVGLVVVLSVLSVMVIYAIV